MAVVRVRILSPLWSLDRELDYLVDDSEEVVFGKRVLVQLGKQQHPEVALITEVLETSEHANRYVTKVLDEPPLLDQAHFEFLQIIARRQCVSLGEVLQHALPDFMPRAAASILRSTAESQQPTLSALAVRRFALLTKPRSRVTPIGLSPDWVESMLDHCVEVLDSGRSAMICVPEISDVNLLVSAYKNRGLGYSLVAQQEDETKSARYLRFRQVSSNEQKLVVGTRAAILWHMPNLGLLAVHDEIDDSFRDPGSPFYEVWETALLRAGRTCSIGFFSPYRSVQLERLIGSGFLTNLGETQPLNAFKTTPPDTQNDSGFIAFVKETTQVGTLLVITARKGLHSSLLCKGCSNARDCDVCGGYYYVDRDGDPKCRVCLRPLFGRCRHCQATEVKAGRVAASRILSDLGKQFPGVRVHEADAQHPANITARTNQILVATVGSAPFLVEGYSGLIIYNAQQWAQATHPNAEVLAFRDWQNSIELLAPSAPILLRYCDPVLAQRYALQQHRDLANELLLEAEQFNLFPEAKYLRMECDSSLLTSATSALTAAGAEVLKVSVDSNCKFVARIPTSGSLQFGDAMRPWIRMQRASKTNPRRRPVVLEMNYQAWRS
jgi:primosomal protein N' (replication factor Y)